MASFEYAYNFMMDNEDRERKHAVVPDPPPGSYAISGINSHYWPDDFCRIQLIPDAERGPAIEEFYNKNFWNHWLADIISDDVAARVFDSGVNQGPGIACKLIQHSVNSLQSTQIEADGKWGPITLAAINNLNPIQLLNKFRDMRAAQYRATGNVPLVPRALK